MYVAAIGNWDRAAPVPDLQSVLLWPRSTFTASVQRPT